MRTVDTHLLEDKMDEAVTHYINSHHPNEPVHIDSNGIPMTVQDDGAGRVTIMHQQTYTTQMCRQVSVTEQVGEGPWGEELLEGPIAAIVAHLQNSRHHPTTHHKISQVRSDAVDSSVILDGTMRFNGQSLEQQSEPIVVQLPPMQTLPPLQDMKRCDADWFSNKNKKDDQSLLQGSERRALETAHASPHHKQPSRKSLPHKKRISRKLKRNNGNSTPQQEQLVVINCSEAVPVSTEQEQILPDNYVAVPHTTHIPHDVRPVFVCQECGDYYGEEQLKFYHHLKSHYEPHHTIIIENPVPDLPIDKISSNCIVDNVATLPDSIVELSLENTVPKTLYQPIEKHILYSTSDKTLSYDKVQYSMANMVASAPSAESDKTYRKQREQHARETHASNTKLEDMGEFSEPEDLMAGIQVCVPEAAYEPGPGPGPGAGAGAVSVLLPHLTVDNGHVHQHDHPRHWYSRTPGASGNAPGAPNGPCDVYCGVCAREPDTPYKLLKEEVLQRILDTEVSDNANFADNMMNDHDQDDHNDQSHGHNDHGQSHNDHGHNNHGHSLNDHSLGHNDHSHGHNDHSHGHNDHSNGHNENDRHSESHIHQHHIQNEHADSLRHSEHSQNSQEHDNDQNHSHDHGHDLDHDNNHGHELDHGHLTESHSSHWQLHLAEQDQMDHGQEHNERVQEHDDQSQEQYEHSQEHDEPGQGLSEASQEHIAVKPEKVKSFICTKCARVFFHRNSLIYHMLSHKDKQHKCTECSKSFLTVGALRIHARTHNDIRPYKCEMCGRQFRQWSDLKYHRNSLHSDKKHFKCEHCGKEFARKYSLSLHEKVHTGEKNFKCELCNKSFRCSSYKSAHMRTHTGDRPYKCIECDKGFRSSFDLRRHATTHEKQRNRYIPLKPKGFKEKKSKESVIDTETGKVLFHSEQIEIIPKYGSEEAKQKKSKQIAVASTARQAVLIKKPAKPKKSNRKGIPNVTVQSRDVYKTDDETSFVYTVNVYDKPEYSKAKHVYDDKIPIIFKEVHNQTKELAVLRPLSHRVESATEKLPYRAENTDGKMQVFTHLEKGISGPVLGDIRHLEREDAREVRTDIAEGESGFIERLTAMYSISSG